MLRHFLNSVHIRPSGVSRSLNGPAYALTIGYINILHFDPRNHILSDNASEYSTQTWTDTRLPILFIFQGPERNSQ